MNKSFMSEINLSQKEADICLLLEGTYPYIRGGVSGWVHQLIEGLPEFTFTLIFIGSHSEEYGDIHYTLPENVVGLHTHFIMEKKSVKPPRRRSGNLKIYTLIRDLHSYFRKKEKYPEEFIQNFTKLITDNKKFPIDNFLYHERAWEKIRQDYLEHSDHPSFLNYFWMIRTLHTPIFALTDIVDKAPLAKVYHSISTGYAGFLGSLLQRKKQRSLILSEHGIYTKERKIDLAQASWIADQVNMYKTGMDNKVGYLRNLAIRFFETLGRTTYNAANPVISLSQANRERQIADGATPETTRVIPNGIRLDRFKPMRTQRKDSPPPILGLIGRIVPIKDVKTFVRAIRILCNYIPNAEGWIIGPEDEDPEYAAECKTLAVNLDVEKNVQFLGFQKIDDFLPQLGLLTLTSISEGQPLVILEAFASGLPVIATDVGFCRGMIEGDSEEDRFLGTAGRITPIADPSSTAHAAMELLQDHDKWRNASRVAQDRVDRYYDEGLFFERYRTLYEEAIG